jgi:hypothetical protein
MAASVLMRLRGGQMDFEALKLSLLIVDMLLLGISIALEVSKRHRGGS